MNKHFATRYQLGNAHYPSLQVYWVEDEDQMGYKGACNIWIDGNTKVECGESHTVSVREGNPIGSISFYFDDVMCGCWKMGMIDGTEITKRDLQLITAWVALAIESEHRHNGCAVTEGCRQKDEKQEFTDFQTWWDNWSKNNLTPDLIQGEALALWNVAKDAWDAGAKSEWSV